MVSVRRLVVVVAAGLAACGPAVGGGTSSHDTHSGSSSGSAESATTMSTVTTGDTAGDTTGDSTVTSQGTSAGSSTTGDAPTLCLDAWILDIPGGNDNVHLDLDGDGLDEMWRIAGRHVESYSLVDGQALALQVRQFPTGNSANLADVDGDGAKDVLVIEEANPQPDGARYYTIDASGILSDDSIEVPYDGPIVGWFLDMDADGDDDVVRFDQDALVLTVSENAGASFSRLPDVDLSSLLSGSNGLARVAPFGDGRFLLSFTGGFGSMGDTFALYVPAQSQVSAIGQPSSEKQLVAVADVDTDGMMDFLAIERIDDRRELALYGGQGSRVLRERLSDRNVTSAALGDFEERGSHQVLYTTADATIHLLRIDTREELLVQPPDTVFSALRSAANFDAAPGDEVYLELCEFTCTAGYGRLGPCP